MKKVLKLNYILNFIAAITIFAMMLLTFTDVSLRYAIRSPITATYDITGLLGLIAISLAMGYTYLEKGHISVDFLILRVNKSFQYILRVFSCFVSLVLSILVTWRSTVYGLSLLSVGETSPTVKIPYAPFAFIIALGFLSMSLLIIADFVKLLAQGIKK